MNPLKKVHILHTNDLHSHFEMMPKVYTVLSDLKKEMEAASEAVILVDIGDHTDRFSVETEGTDGMANRAVLEATGYQLVTLGNNELLTFSKEELYQLYQTAPFEVVSTNVKELNGERPTWMKPWTICHVEGFRIGFLAATIPYPKVYELLGWKVSDPLKELMSAVSYLQQETDAIVVLSHLGLGNDRRLAEEISGIDMIIGSHTHHLLEVPERIQGTMIAAAGKFGNYVGHITLEMEKDSNRLIGIDGRCISTASAQPNPALEKMIQEFYTQAEQALSEPFIHLNRPLPIDWFKESPLGNFLADGLLQWVSDADCALVNAGQLLGGLERGPVTRGLLHQVCPHPINPTSIHLRGRQIRDILEDSLVRENQEKAIRGFGFRGKKLGILNLAGLKAEYDPLASSGNRLGTVWIQEKPLEDQQMYRVATIDMLTFGVGYQEFKNGKELKFFLPGFLRDILASHFSSAGSVEQSYTSRWQSVRSSVD
ncbi:bifunctional metallophosphatase/5'-nucleotidase [Melghirimyces algeriensis]|uniref:2',3'-cyclic-nucleotide 2'-phosphodiesterase/5'-or 3'-nucleotidase, 5'-nucleotidase family n=1 Tax=Melghirimyces algeriensis TaxID=910412 RepID=A0A521ELD2_9BACL|nr:bifunctional UDP-sugar hydrolase/5'-nucleotidase [Melghirimyces algeriensis]SMO84724.1 2',3'-cyclic-nucleotide 2'-phosphodiesterase/5'-or 3'-nucleotidase, 5'-nucleotidase family [Melghirimyces algeriensis]